MDKKELNQEELDKMLNEACYNCRDQETLKLVKSLYAQGADLKIGQYHSETPLWKAIANGQILAVEWLLDQGVDIEIKDEFGKTIFLNVIYSYSFGANELKRILMRNPNIDAVDSQGDGYKEIAEKRKWSTFSNDQKRSCIDDKLKLIEKYKSDKLLNEYHYYIKKYNSGNFITNPFKELKKAAAYYICNEYDKEGFCIVKAKVDCNVSEKIKNEINNLANSMLKDASTDNHLNIEYTIDFDLNGEKAYKIIDFEIITQEDINRSLLS